MSRTSFLAIRYRKHLLQTMQYLQSVHLYIYRNPKLNVITTIFFFLYFLFNSSFPILQHHLSSPSWSQNSATDIDICFYFASLIPSVPDNKEILIAQIIAIFNIGIAVCFVVLLFFINSVKIPFIHAGISIIWGYYMPFTSILFSNIFVRSNIIYEFNMGAQFVICSFLHTLLTLLISIHGILNSATPLPISSPFFAKSCFDSFFLVFYFDVVLNLGMHFETSYLYIRSFISLVYSIFILFKPPYLNRHMNFLLLFCSSYDATCNAVSTFYDYPTFYCMAGAFLFSFIIFYIIRLIPIRVRNDVDRFIYLSFIGKTKNAEQLLDTLTFHKDEKYNYKELIQLCIKYRSGRLLSFVNHFIPYSHTIEEIFFFWSAKNICKLQKKMFIDQDYQILNHLKAKSRQDYNEFWHRIWLSDTNPLIKLSTSLASAQMKKQLYALRNYRYNPKIVDLLDDYTRAEVDKQLNERKCKKCLPNILRFDILLIISSLFFLLTDILLFHANWQLTPIMESYVMFETIQLSSLSVHSKIINNTSNKGELVDLMEGINRKFKDFNKGENYFVKTIKQNTDLYEEFTSLKQCISEKSNLLYDCFDQTSAFVQELIAINQNRSIIYSNIGHLEKRTKIGLIAISTFFFLFIIIFLIISLVYISNYMSSFVHKFLFIPKSIVVKLATFDKSVEILNEMPSRWAKVRTLKYMPWTIATHIAFFVFFFFILGTVEFNKYSIKNVANYHDLILNSTSTILNIPLNIIEGYESFRNGDYYQSNLCTSNITDIVEKLHFEPYIGYLKYIPKNIYDIILLNFYNLSLDNESLIASRLLDTFYVDMYRDIDSHAFLPRYYIIKNLAFIYITVVVSFIALRFNHFLGAMMMAEITMIKKLFDLPYNKQLINFINNQRQMTIPLSDQTETRNDLDLVELKQPEPTIHESSSLFELKSHMDDSDPSMQTHGEDETENESRATFSVNNPNDSVLLLGLNNQDTQLNESNISIQDEASFSEFQLMSFDESELFNNDIDMSVFPISLFAVDSDLNVIFATDLSIQQFQIEIGQPFYIGEIDDASVNTITSQIELFKKNVNDATLVILPTEQEDKSIIMKAHYFYSKKDIRLKSVIIYFEIAQFKPERIEKKITRLFYQEFPKFVPLDTQFPIEFPPKLKSFMIVVLSLKNFNTFVENAIHDNLTEMVSGYRSDLSKEIFTLIDTQENFTYIRETQNEFVAALNHEQTSISVWKILETSAAFSKELISLVLKLNKKYNVTMIEPVIMLFKCKEPTWYASNSNMARIDWQADVLLNAELVVKYGRFNTINYSTQKKEMKSPNTTLLKSQKKPNGDCFDLFVVV